MKSQLHHFERGVSDMTIRVRRCLRLLAIAVSVLALLFISVACGVVAELEEPYEAIESDVPNEAENTYESEEDYEEEPSQIIEPELEPPETEPEPEQEPETVYELTPWPEPLPEIGDVISFEGFMWLVLDLEDGKALILSEHIVESTTYNVRLSSERTRWEDSNIRRFLNETFYRDLSGEGRVRIAETINTNSSHRGTLLDHDTVDRLFLLSVEEVVKYFGDSSQIDGFGIFIDDEYNDARIATNSSREARRWWLRCVGFEHHLAVLVMEDGSIFRSGEMASMGSAGVRPAMWIYL
jgi:hypothetical protein